MFNSMKKFFALPTFADEEQNRNTYLLNFITIAYFVVAIKRVRGMRWTGPAWKPVRGLAAAPVPVAQKNLRQSILSTQSRQGKAFDRESR